MCSTAVSHIRRNATNGNASCMHNMAFRKHPSIVKCPIPRNLASPTGISARLSDCRTGICTPIGHIMQEDAQSHKFSKGRKVQGLPVAVASLPFCVPTSSSRISLLHAFNSGPGTYRVFDGPRYGQYQPCAAYHHREKSLLDLHMDSPQDETVRDG